MNYTLANIHTADSYEALKRNGFTDLDVIAYYGTSINDRGQMFIDIKGEYDRKRFNAPKYEVRGTQKCTEESDIDAIRDMALEHMAMDWVYCGRTFNMNKMGWRFAFNDRKGALGLCSHRERKIYLSEWFITSGTREMKMWVNTMVHEIAHAINREMGGRGHDNQWRRIFVSFGGNGDRCSGDTEFGNIVDKPISKYTLVCDSCERQTPSHKVKKRKSACGKCCDKHNGGRYSLKYVLRQIKNY